MLICNVVLTCVIKHLRNGTHKTSGKHSIVNGFRTHHFLPIMHQTFAKKSKMFTRHTEVFNK